MPRYIDAGKLLNNLSNDLPYKGSVKRVLIQAPTADVVEVVRCKDCPNEYTCKFTQRLGTDGYCSEGYFVKEIEKQRSDTQ